MIRLLAAAVLAIVLAPFAILAAIGFAFGLYWEPRRVALWGRFPDAGQGDVEAR